MNRRRLISICLGAGALIAAASALGAASLHPSGKFQTVLKGKTPALLNGKWVFNFSSKSPGSFTTTKSGKVVIRGIAVWTGSKVTITDVSGSLACTGKERIGVYSYSFSGQEGLLRLKPLVELCDGRKLVLTTHPLSAA